MGVVLEALLALQDVELQIVDIRRQLRAKARTVERQADKVRAAREALVTEGAELRRVQMQQDELDVDLKAREALVNKLRDNLNTVRTNKEYAAVLTQLNNEKADKSRLEARAFEILESLEARKRAHAEHQQALQQESQRLADLESQLAVAQRSLGERLAELEQRREVVSRQLDNAALELFNRLSERYEGEVLARVVQVHPRRQEYICEGCNMALAAERANSLLTRDEVITCDNCGRILHMKKSG